MDVADIASYLAQALFLAVSIYVGYTAYRRPTRSNINILIFFALITLIIAVSWLRNTLDLFDREVLVFTPTVAVLALPYVLLRLVRDFASISSAIMRAAEAGLIILTLFVVVNSNILSSMLTLSISIYFIALIGYAAYRFRTSSRSANGITRRRLRALSTASATLGIAIFSVNLQPFLAETSEVVLTVARQLLIAVSGTLYLIGFAPPAVLRRSWQEPELRRFLSAVFRLPQAYTLDELLGAISSHAAHVVGAPITSIGMFKSETGKIHFHEQGKEYLVTPGQTTAGKAYQQQQVQFASDVTSDSPDYHDFYKSTDSTAVLAVPITSEQERIGVIVAAAPNPPIFVEDDLDLLRLIAEQAAVLIEHHSMMNRAAEIQAREEATRMKDDFLSAAAHDLKTPLTSIVGTAQYLERHVKNKGVDSDNAVLTSVQRLTREAKRLQTLVKELLDASQVESGTFQISRERTDLVSVLHEVCDQRDNGGKHTITIDSPDTVYACVDPIRIQQLIENLIENAVKYSPNGGTIHVYLWHEGQSVRLTVSDEGIGINRMDQAFIFDRFHRGSNVNDRRFAGMGLGLYICRGIVEQHGGEIWVESQPEEGSTFHIRIPVKDIDATHESNNSRSRRRPGNTADVTGHPVD